MNGWPGGGTLPVRKLLISGLLPLMAALAMGGACAGAREAPVDSYTVVTGVVTRDGKPAVGVEITVTAWPNDEALTSLGDGEAVDTPEVAHVTTDAQGRFTVSLDPAKLDAAHTGPQGEVDLELMISGYDVHWNLTATRAHGGVDRVWDNPRVDSQHLEEQLAEGLGPTHLLIEIGDKPSVVEAGNEPETWS